MFYYERTTYHEVAWSYVNASDRTSLYADITVSIPGYPIAIILKIHLYCSRVLNFFPFGVFETSQRILYSVETISYSGITSVCVKLKCIFVIGTFLLIIL
jgi:hypothetical protein